MEQLFNIFWVKLSIYGTLMKVMEFLWNVLNTKCGELMSNMDPHTLDPEY